MVSMRMTPAAPYPPDSPGDSCTDRIAYGGVICGEPSAVRDQILALIATTGVGVLGLQMQWGNLTVDEIQESLELFGRYVRAAVR